MPRVPLAQEEAQHHWGSQSDQGELQASSLERAAAGSARRGDA